MQQVKKKLNQEYVVVKNFFKKDFPIPSNWDYVKYKDVLIEVREPISFDNNEEYKLITIKRRNGGLILREILKGHDIKTKTLFSVDKGDFIIAKMQIIHGACGIVPEYLSDAMISGSYIRFKAKNSLNLEYLNWFSHTPLFYQQTFISSVGSNLEKMNFNKDHWVEHFFPLPPINEQIKIVSILSSVQTIIQQTQKIIEQAQTLMKGIGNHLLTKGIKHTKFIKTEFGEIPEEWQVVNLKNIIESYRNGIYKHEKFYGHGYPSIRMYNINNGIIDKINAPLLEVTKEELNNFGLLPDDIVINRVNSDYLVGKAGIVTNNLGPATFESKNIRLRVQKDKCDPEFLNQFFNNDEYLRQIRSFIKTAVAQVTINQEDLNKINVKLPELSEQKKIASIMSSINLYVQKEEEYKIGLENLQRGLIQKLLTGQIRVKV